MSTSGRLCVVCVCLVLGSFARAEHGNIVTEFTCDSCQSDHYCTGANHKEACPSSSTSPQSSNGIHDCVCDGGKRKTCTDDTFDQSCTTDSFTCEIGEPPHYYQDGTRISCPYVEGYDLSYRDRATIANGGDDETDCICIPGYAPIDLTTTENAKKSPCKNCLNGKYKAEANNEACTDCPANTNHMQVGQTDVTVCKCNRGYTGDSATFAGTNADANVCQQCELGKFKSYGGDGVCESCTADFYCPEGTFNPTPCRDNSEVGLGFGTSAESCLCSAGFGFESGDPDACEECETGKARAGAANEACDGCAPGTYADIQNLADCKDCPSDSEHDLLDRDRCLCNAGYVGDHGTEASVTHEPICAACGASKYQDATGKSVCTDCPAASGVAASGSDEESDCKCNAGYTSGDTYCTGCAAGTYKNSRGMEICTNCPHNSNSDTSLDAAAGDLSVESTCVCDAGYEANEHSTGTDFCNACPVGKFKDSPGTQACTDCAANDYQNLAGKSACEDCPDYSSSPAGSDALSDCLCNPGFAGTITDAGDTCSECPAGQFDDGSGICVECDATANEYSPSPAATECLTCAANSVSSEGATKCHCREGYQCRPNVHMAFGGAYGSTRGMRASTISGDCANYYIKCVKGNGYDCEDGIDTFIQNAYGTIRDNLPDCILGSILPPCKIPKQENCISFGSDIATYPQIPSMIELPTQGEINTECVDSIVLNLFYTGTDRGSLGGAFDYQIPTSFRYFYNLKQTNTQWMLTVLNSGPNDLTSLCSGTVKKWQNPSFLINWVLQLNSQKPTCGHGVQADDCNFDLECIGELCVQCATNHYKDVIGYQECTECQANAQTPIINSDGTDHDQESDCKCNRGYKQDGDYVCEACLPGQYSDAYEFDSTGDGTNDLDALACENCNEYHHTETHHPAGDETQCESCSNKCGNGEDNKYWKSGCLIDGYVVDTNNGDYVCGDCPAGLSGTAVADETENVNNRGPAATACVCKPGAYFNDLTYIPGVVDLFTNLAHACGGDQNAACSAQFIGTWKTGDLASNVISNGGSVITYVNNGDSQIKVNLGEVRKIAAIQLRLYDYNVNRGLDNPYNGRGGACGTYFQYDNAGTTRDILNQDGNPVSLSGVYSVGGNVAVPNYDNGDAFDGDLCKLGNDKPPFRNKGIYTFSNADGQKIAELQVANSGIAEYTFFFPEIETQYVTLISQHSGPTALSPWIFSKFEQLQIFGLTLRDPGCDHCPAGKYKSQFQTYITARDSSSGYMQCTDCPDYKSTASPGATNLGDCACQAGYTLDESQEPAICIPCAAESFKNSVADGQCTSCDSEDTNSGSWDAAGTTEITGLSACTCDAGYDRQGGVCTACPAGKFKAFGGDYACEDCAAGTYVHTQKAIVCTTCQDNSGSGDGAAQCECDAGYQQINDLGAYDASGFECQACVFVSNDPTQMFFKEGSNTNACELCTALCGISGGVPQYASTVCDPTQAVVCEECDSCTDGNHAYTECDYNDALNTGNTECRICEVGSYCPHNPNYFQDQMIQCPNGATSEAGSISEDDCGCPAGEYTIGYGTSGDSNYQADQTVCTPCLTDHWCVAGQLFRCPVNSFLNLATPGSVTAADHSDSLNCHCNPGYYRHVFFAAECTRENAGISMPCEHGSFGCLECHNGAGDDDADTDKPDGYYCTDNERRTCPVHSHTPNLAADSETEEDCKCIPGYYKQSPSDACEVCIEDSYCAALSDDATPCGDVGDNRHTKGLTGRSSPGHCVCQPGFYSPNKNANAGVLDDCEECPAHTVCPGNGDDKSYPCPLYSELSSVSNANLDTANCLCQPGYGCDSTNPGGNCPGIGGVNVVGSCTACTTSTSLSGGEFKNVAENSPCIDCDDCSASTGNAYWVNPQCSVLANRECQDCVSCSDQGDLKDPPRQMYQVSACDVQNNIACADCDVCARATHFQETECLQNVNTVCKPITEDASGCNIGEYRQAPSADITQDSSCQACSLNAGAPDGMHTWTGTGVKYDDASSCPFICANDPSNNFYSVLADQTNPLHGCQSCNTGRYLLKIFTTPLTQQIQNQAGKYESWPTECQFTCREGSYREDDDCVPSHQSSSSGFQGLLSVDVELPSSPSGHSGDYTFELEYSIPSRFALMVAPQPSSCEPGDGLICMETQFLISNLNDMGLIDNSDNAAKNTAICGECGVSLPAGISAIQTPNSVRLTVPEEKLGEIADCVTVLNTCKLAFTLLDVLTLRKTSERLEILKHLDSQMSAQGHLAQQYLPLSVFQAEVRLLANDIRIGPDNFWLYEITVEVEITSELLAQGGRLSMYLAGFEFVDSAQRQSSLCDRYQAQTSTATSTDTHAARTDQSTFDLLSAAGKSRLVMRTVWKTPYAAGGNAPFDILNAIVSIHSVYSEAILGLARVSRHVSNYVAVCDNPTPTDVHLQLGHVLAGVGLLPSMSQLEYVPVSSIVTMQTNGAQARLLNLIIHGPADVPVSISDIKVFAVHTKTLIAETSITTLMGTDTIITHSTIDNTLSGFTTAVKDLQSSDIRLEVVRDFHAAMHIIPVSECRAGGNKDSSVNWLNTNFGNVPAMHLTTLCQDASSSCGNCLTSGMAMVKLQSFNPTGEHETRSFLWISALVRRV